MDILLSAELVDLERFRVRRATILVVIMARSFEL